MARDELSIARDVIGIRPLVLTGVTRDRPAMQRGSPQDLKARFGQLDVEIDAERSAGPNCAQNKLDHRRNANPGEFVDQLPGGSATNDQDLTATNDALRRPEFAPPLADIGTLPEVCDRAELARLSSFWFGPAGTHTPLHHDTLMPFHTQVVGRKRWRFIAPLQTPRPHHHHNEFRPIDLDRPDFSKYPLFRDVKVLEVTAEPDDSVFLPFGGWHQPTALDTSLSFSYSNLAVPNHYNYLNPEIRNW
ncbi:MAG: cupin-like domain-containing protein [Bacteriovorax sp.]|nr:cupin-like domain-containing protein [Rhizobacter sp.]